MPDLDAFETAYGRLLFAGLAARLPREAPAGGEADPAPASSAPFAAPSIPHTAAPSAAPSAARDTPRSRLLLRLALMAPRARSRRRPGGVAAPGA